MSLKISPETINSETIRHITKLLSENKNALLKDNHLIKEITKLKNVLAKLEDSILAKRSKAAAKKLSAMTEEERQMLLMWPEEKKFFLRYKKQHPDDPWGYAKEYQQHI